MTTISGLVTEQKKAEILQIAKKARRYLKIPKSVKIHIALGILTDCGEINQLGKNHYQIWLDKTLTRGMTAEVIGHECQHIKQFLDGRLEIKKSDTGLNLIYFEGICMTSVPYNQRPFELEAKKVGREFSSKKKLVF